MQRKIVVVALALLLGLGRAGSMGRAAVVVLANRTAEAVQFQVVSAAGGSRSYTLSKGDVLALPRTPGLEVVYPAAGTKHRCRTHSNEIYCFMGDAKTLRLKQLVFRGAWSQPWQDDADDGDPVNPSAASKKVLVSVTVKILVDQAEPTVQNVWEKRLRSRVEQASAMLERVCRVRLEVIEAGTWESDGRLTKLSELLRDFREKVVPGKARLAIGFTGQRQALGEDTALGCTPAPLHTHILLREYKSRTESDRLEVLLHELGHFLGAFHSPDRDSVMRPKLGEGRANLRAFRIGFDPINTLVMNLVAEDLARRPLRRLDQVSPRTRRRLLDIFSTAARTAVDEPSSSAYFVRLLGGTPPEGLTVRPLSPAVLESARAVVAAIMAEAKPKLASLPSDGDALTESYFRAAAAACRRLPPKHAPDAYLLGLAVALDQASLLHFLGLHSIGWGKIESEAERRLRRKVLGEPTMYGRVSLMQNFVLSATLQMLVEGQSVSAASIQEDLLLLQGSDRFHFDDLMASLAGIRFAAQLDTVPAMLDELATSFRIPDYLLPLKELPGPLDCEEFRLKYGSTTNRLFLDQQDALGKRLLALPGYQPRKKTGARP